jgi:hypothetical protein
MELGIMLYSLREEQIHKEMSLYWRIQNLENPYYDTCPILKQLDNRGNSTQTSVPE